MSVINKMLRDLDQRSAATVDPALRFGTRLAGRPHANAPAKAPGLRIVVWCGIGAALLVLGLSAWWGIRPPISSPAAAPINLPPVETLQAPAQPAAQTATLEPPAMAATAPIAVSSAPPRIDALTPSKTTAQSPAPAKEAPKSVLPIPESGSLRLASSGNLLPSSSSVVSAPASTPAVTSVVPAPDPLVASQRQQSATREVLAQAQTLYSSGSADAAIQLLQDTLHTAERANPPAPAATQLQLVRELARMELAQGRAAAVLELLGRSESLMVAQPDLWAVRANASQRVGRHQDALQFYATALQARPAEQRWLLGSAVSQAALGQLAAAAESAEKARAIAPVSKEVLTYLRQQGVAINEKP